MRLAVFPAIRGMDEELDRLADAALEEQRQLRRLFRALGKGRHMEDQLNELGHSLEQQAAGVVRRHRGERPDGAAR